MTDPATTTGETFLNTPYLGNTPLEWAIAIGVAVVAFVVLMTLAIPVGGLRGWQFGWFGREIRAVAVSDGRAS